MSFSALRPTRRRLDVAFAIFACGVGNLGVAAADGTKQNNPGVVAPITIGGATGKVGPIKIEGATNRIGPISPIGSVAAIPALGSVVPIPAIGRAGSVGNVTLNLSAIQRDAALLQVEAGALTLEEAWQSGAVDYDNIADLLGNEADVYVIHYRGEDKRLRHQLVELLLQHESARFDSLAKVPQRVRLWLADYYQSQGNEKAIAVAESIVAEHQQPTKGLQDIVFQALERQAWFYQGQRKYELAAEAWKRASSYVTNTDWMIPDAIWQTGRMYLWAGKPDMAEPYFVRASEQKNKFIVTMVTYDKVGALLGAGKNAEASQLARETLQQVQEPVDRAINLMLLSKSLYAGGDFARAQVAATHCIGEAAKAKNVNAAIGFDVVSPTAQDLLMWSQLWQNQPLVCSPKLLSYKVNTRKSARKIRINVRSFKTVPLSVKCNDARVKCTVVLRQDDPWFPRRETRFAEQTIEVEVPLATALQTELQISSAQLPEATCDIPLQISS